MKTRMLAAVMIVMGVSPAPAGAGQSAQQAATAEPLAMLAPLIGSWQGGGTGFSTTLRYEWQVVGRIIGVSNEVRGANGAVIARYYGTYAWDAGRKEIVFWTAGGSGEVHRGRAWWQDGVLWHEAEVSGGSIAAYASAVRPVAGRLDYFAAYGTKRAEPALLESTPITYTPRRD